MSLTDRKNKTRVAIVTGGGTGIGRATCFELARNGFAVVAADIDGTAAQRVAAEIESADGKAAGVACDVSKDNDWKAVLDKAAELGRLDTLVGNAAIYPRVPFIETSIGDFDRVMGVNLRGIFLGAYHCWPIVRDAGGGAFVLITSGSGQITAATESFQQGFSLYGASKAALDRWAFGVAPELAPHGIAVNLLSPGAVVMTEGVSRLQLNDETPSNSISAERMAEAIAHLANARPPNGTGHRYLATEFGTIWGADPQS